MVDNNFYNSKIGQAYEYINLLFFKLKVMNKN